MAKKWIRILVDVGELKSGAAAEVEASVAKSLIESGQADDHPEAVAYAKADKNKK